MTEPLTHTRLPETGTPPALAATRLLAMVSHALSYPQQPPAHARSATILAFGRQARRHAWTTGLATAGLAAALMLAVLPGTFDTLTHRSTITAGGLGHTATRAASISQADALNDVSDMLTLNTLESVAPGADDRDTAAGI